MTEHPFNQYKEHLMPCLISKREEFELYGYDRVTIEEIWSFLTLKKWKKVNEEIKIYQITNDILQASISDIMNFIQVEAYKSPNFLETNNLGAFKDLLK